MKRLVLIIVLLSVLVGCNKNPVSNHCDPCEQVYDSQVLPVLDKNDYNDCGAVAQNFVFMSRATPCYAAKYPNPYHKNEGDTIKIKGFIKHSYGKPIRKNNDGIWTASMIVDSLTAMDPNNHLGGDLRIEGADTTIFNTVDITKKCYVTAIISFHKLVIPYEEVKPGQCRAVTPAYIAIEIKN
ncbi:MAG: hypothetical protein IKR71_06000 [Bacteroidales bacterium]|nr:hypothetical protein [Bacteroidales bacterium]